MVRKENDGPNSKYWKEYTAIQKAKHTVLQEYLKGWFPILSSFSKKILYVETHAGKGKHETGDIGSPLVALNTLLKHSRRNKILSNCYVDFLLIEQVKEYAVSLYKEIKKLEPLPENCNCTIRISDYEEFLENQISLLKRTKTSFAPSLFFIDPFGFVLPLALIKELFKQDKCELLITYMIRHKDMAIFNPHQEENLNKTFAGTSWKQLKDINDPGMRQQKMVDIFIESLGPKYNSVLQMKGEHNEPVYCLLHLTNHPRGKNLMKDAMWKVSKDGSFKIFKGDDPRQLALIEPEPNLNPLKNKLLEDFTNKNIQYNDLKDWLIPLPWREPHLNNMLKKLFKNKKIKTSDGKLVFKHNPIITFSRNGN